MHAASHTPQGLAVRGTSYGRAGLTTMGDPNACTAFGKGEHVSKRARLLAEAVGRWLGRTAQAHLLRAAPGASSGERCTATAQTPVLERVQQEKEVQRPLMFIGSVSKEHGWGPCAPQLLSLKRSHPLSALCFRYPGSQHIPLHECSETKQQDWPGRSPEPLSPTPETATAHTLESQKQGRGRRSWVGSAEPP